MPCLLLTGIYLTFRTRGSAVYPFLEINKADIFKRSQFRKRSWRYFTFCRLNDRSGSYGGKWEYCRCCTAIAMGGPGAPVYMWIAGIFGMATKYAEGFLGVEYREIAPNGTMAGGPMYYVKNGLKNKKIGKLLGRRICRFWCDCLSYRNRQYGTVEFDDSFLGKYI